MPHGILGLLQHYLPMEGREGGVGSSGAFPDGFDFSSRPNEHHNSAGQLK
jgi:hypothetical protein